MSDVVAIGCMLMIFLIYVSYFILRIGLKLNRIIELLEKDKK